MSSISDVAAYIFSGTIPPSGVAAQVLVKVLPAVFELWADKTDPVEIGTHSETLVFFLYLLVPGVLLGERLVVQGQSQHDVSPDLSGMKRAVKASEFHRMMPMEEAVEIEKMIAAVMVVLVAIFSIALIPNTFDVRKGRRFGLVHTVNQPNVHFLTVTHTLRLDL